MRFVLFQSVLFVLTYINIIVTVEGRNQTFTLSTRVKFERQKILL